jgi:hypothetical protein
MRLAVKPQKVKYEPYSRKKIVTHAVTRARIQNNTTNKCSFHLQANYINALAVSVSAFFEPAMPMTLGGLFVALGGFRYDIG